jgi:hypothetical protein
MVFHWKNGWYWSRLSDGSVEVRNHGNFEGGDPNHTNGDGRTTLTISPSEWASIVCSVSIEGETDVRWEQVQRFHGGPWLYPLISRCNQPST